MPMMSPGQCGCHQSIRGWPVTGWTLALFLELMPGRTTRRCAALAEMLRTGELVAHVFRWLPAGLQATASGAPE
jgi:hypothetical protein